MQPTEPQSTITPDQSTGAGLPPASPMQTPPVVGSSAMMLRRWCRPGAPEPLDAFTPTNRSSCADFRHPTVQQNRHACLAFTGLRSGRRVLLAVCIRRAPLKLNRASESDASHRSTLR